MGDDQFSPHAAAPQPQDAAPETTRLLDANGNDVTAPAPIDLPDPAEVFARLGVQAPAAAPATVPADAGQTVPTAALAVNTPTEPLPTAPLPMTTPPVVQPMAAPAMAAPPMTPSVVPFPEPVADENSQELDQDTRDRLLGNVPPVEDDAEVPPLTRHDNDKFVGSFGLFWLRLVAAAVLGIHAVQMLMHESTLQTWLGTLPFKVPEPNIVAWALPIILLVVAVFLVIGLLTRTAAVITVLWAVALLVFVDWGTGSIFAGAPAQGGFIGDFDLLLAGVGIGLAFLGAGGWSFDGHRRLVKARRKLYN